MEKYTLQPGKNLLWTCTDNESGLVITFREGLFNDSQIINIDNLKGVDSPMAIPRLLTGMTDWLAENHRNIIECNIEARCSAIYALNSEEFWKLLAELLNGHIVTDEDGRKELGAAVEDAEPQLFEKWGVDREELLYRIGGLVDCEAYEVFCLCRAFWEYHTDEWMQTGIDEWTRDLLWWSAFLPQERREPQSAEDFGRELHYTRQSLDITLQELSQRSGVDAGLISKIENGKVNPTLQNLLKISNAMGCDIVFES